MASVVVPCFCWWTVQRLYLSRWQASPAFLPLKWATSRSASRRQPSRSANLRPTGPYGHQHLRQRCCHEPHLQRRQYTRVNRTQWHRHIDWRLQLHLGCQQEQTVRNDHGSDERLRIRQHGLRYRRPSHWVESRRQQSGSILESISRRRLE